MYETNLQKNINDKENVYWFFRSTTSKSEKRSLENEPDDKNDDEEQPKKPRIEEEGQSKVTESILDDIRLEDIESRISVHVLESPESCTHEVAVYPGKYSDFILKSVNVLFFVAKNVRN